MAKPNMSFTLTIQLVFSDNWDHFINTGNNVLNKLSLRSTQNALGINANKTKAIVF